MPLFLDGPGAERIKRVADAVLNGPQNGLPERFQAPRDEDPTRRVLVTGAVAGGLYPAKIQYYDSDAGAWADFDGPDGEPLTCRARAWDGTALEDATAYGPATVVGFDPDSELAVFAVPVGGSAGAFSGAAVRHSTSQALSGSGVITLTWDTETFDTDGYHTGGSPTLLTVPEDGYYIFGAQAQIDDGTTNIGRFRLLITDSGVIGRIAYCQVTPDKDETLAIILNITSRPVFMTAGQWMRADCGQFTGVASNVASADTFFWVMKLSGADGGGGSGTVTSVAMTVPSDMTISGSPINTSGTLGLGWFGGNDWIDTIDGGTG